MGYDLNFWAYADESVPRGPKDHLAVYRALCAGDRPDGVRDLPVDAIRAGLDDALAGWNREDDHSFERAGVSIEVLTTPFWVRFDLFGDWTGDDANALIDLMKPFGCPLFDPQADRDGVRFSLG